MRVRLRAAYTPAELAALYREPHRHARWRDHQLRVALTIEIARLMHRGGTIADLSCGDATIARALPAPARILGDLAPGYELCGPIEQTIEQIPAVDLFVCCETIEHLDDPDGLLARIRRRTRALVLSTPEAESTPENPEHYWGWDLDAVADMLANAGFTPSACSVLRLPSFGVSYQIWGCE